MRARSTILFKLACLIGALLFAVVAFLGVYFPSRQLESLSEALVRRTESYARLMSTQLGPAIAFDDRQTAREIFEAVAQDPDVEGLALYDAKGKVLHAHGQTPPLELATREATPHRIVTTAPVVSLEGPRGTLVVALSTKSLAEVRSSVATKAFSIGLATLLLGVLAAWLIARTIARRLQAIARAATRVAAGDLETEPVEDTNGDEIGTLAGAFNAMLAQLRALIDRLQTSAREEQDRLERLIAERTRDLDLRNQEMRLVLDNVGQGFVTLDRQGRMSRERSKILEKWFGPATGDPSFWSYVSGGDADRRAWFECCFEQVLDGFLPLDVAISQMPETIESAERALQLEYRPIFDEAGALLQLVVVISDRTSERERARAAADEADLQQLISRLLADRSGFMDFMTETDRLVSSLERKPRDSAFARDVHTLKGLSAMFKLSVTTLCHELEERLREDDSAGVEEHVRRISRRWRELSAKLTCWVGSRGASTIEIDEHTLQQLFAAIDAQRPHAELRRMIAALSLEPVSTRLSRIAEHAKLLAERLQKGPIEVRIEADQTRLDPAQWSSVWSTTVHVVRNAIDHGLETRDERRTAGKSNAGCLLLASRSEADDLVVEVSDFGKGVDWAALERRARERGLPAESTIDLVNAMFADGVTTRAEASDVSGRGLGLAAVKAECERRGGRVDVKSTTGEGTSVIMRWPMRSAPALE